MPYLAVPTPQWRIKMFSNKPPRAGKVGATSRFNMAGPWDHALAVPDAVLAPLPSEAAAVRALKHMTEAAAASGDNSRIV